MLSSLSTIFFQFLSNTVCRCCCPFLSSCFSFRTFFFRLSTIFICEFLTFFWYILSSPSFFLLHSVLQFLFLTSILFSLSIFAWYYCIFFFSLCIAICFFLFLQGFRCQFHFIFIHMFCLCVDNSFFLLYLLFFSFSFLVFF
jgi:hypothetical protein